MSCLHFHLPVSFGVKLAFTLWRVSLLILNNSSISAAPSNNHVSQSNTLTENPPTLYSSERHGRADDKFTTGWRIILDKKKTNFERQSLSRPSVIFTEVVFSELFTTLYEYSVVKSIWKIECTGIEQMVNELVPHLSNLLFWKYKLKMCVLFSSSGSENSWIEIKQLITKIKEGQLSLIKLILVIGCKKIKDGSHNIRNNTDINDNSKQFIIKYYVQILSFCQVMYKIDSTRIQQYTNDIKDIVQSTIACNTCLNLYMILYQSELLDKLKAVLQTFNDQILCRVNELDQETVKRIEDAGWLLTAAEETLSGWKIDKEVNEKDILFLNMVISCTNWELMNVLGCDEDMLNDLVNRLGDIRSQISKITAYFEENHKIHEQACLRNVFFKLFESSLSQVYDSSLIPSKLLLCPDLLKDEILSLKTANIISERKECDAEWIEHICSSVLNTNILSIDLPDGDFPRGVIILLHSIAEYLIETKVKIEHAEFTEVEKSFEELIEKDEIFFNNIVAVYFKIRSLWILNDSARSKLWNYILEMICDRRTKNLDMDLKIHTAQGIIIAFYMLNCGLTDLEYLEANYQTHWREIRQLIKEPSEEEICIY